MPELHPQRPAELQLLLEAARGQHVDGVPREVCNAGMGSTLPSALVLLRKRNRPRKRRRIRKLRLLALLALLGVLGLSAFTAGLMTALASAGPGSSTPSTRRARSRTRRLRERRPHGPRGPPRRQARVIVPSEEISPLDQAGDRRDRGQALLRAPRRRRPRHRPRALVRPHRRPGRGRLDDHAAVRQEHDQRQRPDAAAQAQGGDARVADRAEVVEGPDPDRVPEHDLLRERRLRRRGGLAASTSATAPPT